MTISNEILTQIRRYKQRVASRHRALKISEASAVLSGEGFIHITAKVDGWTWFAVIEHGKLTLVSSKGRTLNSAPIQKAWKDIAPRFDNIRESGPLIIAGELYACTNRLHLGGRARCADLAALMGENNPNGDGISFAAFDIVNKNLPFPARLELLKTAFNRRSTNALHVVRSCLYVNPADDDFRRLYHQWVESGEYEGLVVYADNGRSYKIKPEITFDAVVVGVTTDSSLLLAMVRPDGKYQIIGRCGTSPEMRDELPVLTMAPGNHIEAARSSAVYDLVAPDVVLEVRATDIQQAEKRRAVLDWDNHDGWEKICMMPTISLHGAQIVRIRHDKTASGRDVRIEQILDRVHVEGIQNSAETPSTPASTIVRRQVWCRVIGQDLMVRALSVIKTNKTGPDWSPFAVQLCDISPRRANRIRKTVHLAAHLEAAHEIADELSKSVPQCWEYIQEIGL